MDHSKCPLGFTLSLFRDPLLSCVPQVCARPSLMHGQEQLVPGSQPQVATEDSVTGLLGYPVRRREEEEKKKEKLPRRQ